MISLFRNFILLFIIICLFVPGPAREAGAAELVVMTENFPPYNYVEEGRLQGPSSRIVEEIMNRLGLRIDIRVLPWPRAYRLIQENDGCVLFSMARTPEREKLFRWVGPLMTYDVSLIKKKGSEVKAADLEEAKKYLVGVKRDTAGHRWLVKNGFPRIYIDYTTDNYPLPTMLVKGRVDLWLMGNMAARYMAAASGVDPDSLEPELVIFKQSLYIAFSRSMDDNTVQAWSRALKEIENDGTYDRIIAEYQVVKCH